jgi:hypothetical protein
MLPDKIRGQKIFQCKVISGGVSMPGRLPFLNQFRSRHTSLFESELLRSKYECMLARSAKNADFYINVVPS